MTDDILDSEIAFHNYDMVRTDSNNSRTGGVVTYILKNIKFKIIYNSNQAIDGTWINCVQINGKSDNFYLCNIYRSPSNKISQFTKKIVELAEQWTDLSKLIVLGDFNTNVSKNSFYTNKLIYNMKLIGLDQKIMSPTISTFNSATIIDLLFTNFQLSTMVLDKPKIADHNIIYAKLNNKDYNINNNKSKIITFRDYNNFDEKLFQEEIAKLRSIDFTVIDCDDNNNGLVLNERIVNVFSNIVNILDSLPPKRSKKVKY